MSIIERCCRWLVAIFLFLVFSPQAVAADDTSAKKAEELFRKVYAMVMGDQGSSFQFGVNIIGIYKTEGFVVYKGKKSHFEEERYLAWDNGTTSYRVDKKKNVVNVYRSDDESQHRFLSKFKYDLDGFLYSYSTKGDYYELVVKAKNSKFFGVREAKIMVQRKDLSPVSLTVKVAFMSATVHIMNFKAGNISDDNFVFPRDKYKDYSFTDHRSGGEGVTRK